MSNVVQFDFVANPEKLATGAKNAAASMASLASQMSVTTTATVNGFEKMANAARGAANSAKPPHGGGGGGGEDEHGGGLHAWEKQGRSLLGRRSTAGHLMHLVEGGGAAWVATAGAKALTEMGEKVSELIEQFHEGQIGAGAMVEELVKGVPIVGTFTKMWESLGGAIKEAFGGKSAARELKELEEQLKKNNAAIALKEKIGHEARYAGLSPEQAEKKRLADELKETRAEIAATQREGAISAAEAAKLDAVALESHRKKMEVLEKKERDAEEKKLDEERKKKRAPMDEALKSAQQRLQVAAYGKEEYELVKLALAGATDEEIKQIKALQESAAALEARNKNVEEAKKLEEEHRKSIESTLKSLHDQTTEMLMGKDAYEDFKLSALGASEAERQLAQHSRDALEAARIKESVATPAEKMKDEVEKLARLHERGALDAETYSRALRKAAKEMSGEKAVGGGAYVGIADLARKIDSAGGEEKSKEMTADAKAIIAAAEKQAKDQLETEKQTAQATQRTAAAVEKGIVGRFA